jgi:predicted nucleotidyltransferase component of viral defense system
MSVDPEGAFASGLTRRELAAYVEQFGVAEEQVHRDHLISILLAALSASGDAESVLFFGGTALSRTQLTSLRLSEDIDLLALVPRAELAGRLQRVLERAVARTHGQVSWAPTLAGTTGSQAATMIVAEGLRVQVQLLAADHYPPWPVETATIEQRYTDVAPAQLRTLTLEAFVAAKTAAWIDRRAPRDLYDLYALAGRGASDTAAADLFRRLGPTGGAPGAWAFDTIPTEEVWRAALGHQCRLNVTAAEALDVVARAWRTAGR